jgi:hypothetical protein
MSIKVDADALLCALVLAPRTFARNRFFSLYTQSAAKHARARAAELRTIVRPGDDGFIVLRYGVPGIRMERTAVLDALELPLLRFALWRASSGRAHHGAELAVTDDDRDIVQRAVSKLDDGLGHHREYGLQPGSD